MSKLLSSLCVAAALGITCQTAHAQAWPASTGSHRRSVRSGGPADVIARVVAKKAGEVLQRPSSSTTRGAGGTIGLDAALKSPPDGYTFARPPRARWRACPT